MTEESVRDNGIDTVVDGTDVVSVEGQDLDRLVRVTAADPPELIKNIRIAVAEGQAVLVAPDSLAPDHDEWIALAAAALLEGAAALETRNLRDARRLFDVRQAIASGGEDVEW